MELAERAEFQWNLRAQELGSATKDSDGKRPAALLKLSARDRPARDTEAVGAQYDRRAIRKLSARNTTVGATEAVGARED